SPVKVSSTPRVRFRSSGTGSGRSIVDACCGAKNCATSSCASARRARGREHGQHCPRRALPSAAYLVNRCGGIDVCGLRLLSERRTHPAAAWKSDRNLWITRDEVV